MKKSKLIIAALAVLVFGITTAAADPNDFKNAIGIFGLASLESESNSVGGLQYQRWVTEKIGFQVEGSVYYDPENTYYSFDSNLNFELQYKLYQTNIGARNASVLYAWALIGASGTAGSEFNSSRDEYVPTGPYFDANVGLGFGFDLNFINHLSVPIQFGFLGKFPNELAAGFSVGAGIRYRY